MKKRFAFLFLLVMVATALVPCCTKDDCAADVTALQKQQDNKDKAGHCSPFFSCISCAGFTTLQKPVQPSVVVVTALLHRPAEYTFYFPEYSATFWQPPRIG